MPSSPFLTGRRESRPRRVRRSCKSGSRASPSVNAFELLRVASCGGDVGERQSAFDGLRHPLGGGLHSFGIRSGNSSSCSSPDGDNAAGADESSTHLRSTKQNPAGLETLAGYYFVGPGPGGLTAFIGPDVPKHVRRDDGQIPAIAHRMPETDRRPSNRCRDRLPPSPQCPRSAANSCQGGPACCLLVGEGRDYRTGGLMRFRLQARIKGNGTLEHRRFPRSSARVPPPRLTDFTSPGCPGGLAPSGKSGNASRMVYTRYLIAAIFRNHALSTSLAWCGGMECTRKHRGRMAEENALFLVSGVYSAAFSLEFVHETRCTKQKSRGYHARRVRSGRGCPRYTEGGVVQRVHVVT